MRSFGVVHFFFGLSEFTKEQNQPQSGGQVPVGDVELRRSTALARADGRGDD